MTRREIQIQVLRELTSPSSFQWNVRESYSRIAKKLGVDEEMVRLSVKRAKQSGLVQEWRLVLNPDLMGEKSAAIQLDINEKIPKDDAINKIKLVDNVFLIFDFHGRAIRTVFNFVTERGMERKKQLLQSICQSDEVLVWTTTNPPCRLKVKSLDWEILKAISKDPRRSLDDVARETTVSRRTVSRRLNAMIEGKMFYLIPVRNLKKFSGLLCNYIVLLDEKSRSLIAELMLPMKAKVDFEYKEKGLYNVSIVLDNITQADELSDQLGKIEGVREVKMNIVKNFIYIDEWLEDILQRKIAES